MGRAKVSYTVLNKKLISKRTEKNTVAFVGFAHTSRHLAPWDDPDTEIWCMNESYNAGFVQRATRWFQIHSQANFSRVDNPNDPNHYKWLQEKHEFPIYMQHKYHEIPSSVSYPLEEVIALTGNRYFTSTFAYMMALAILEGFERIELYGFEMASDTEYAHQRACGEFWIGVALGKGIEVYLPDQCNLLSGQMYGYEKMSIGFRQQLELRKQKLAIDLQNETGVYHRISGVVDFLDDLRKGERTLPSLEDINTEYKAMKTELNKQEAAVNALAGQKAENGFVTRLYDHYPFEEDRGDDAYVSLEGNNEQETE